MAKITFTKVYRDFHPYPKIFNNVDRYSPAKQQLSILHDNIRDLMCSIRDSISQLNGEGGGL